MEQEAADLLQVWSDSEESGSRDMVAMTTLLLGQFQGSQAKQLHK